MLAEKDYPIEICETTFLRTSYFVTGNCQKPVIAAIHGKCIGAGMDLVSFTDVRYCTKDAAFCVKEVALGFVFSFEE